MCVCVCVCDLLFDLVRPPSQGPASYQIKAASCGLWKKLCVCVCACVCVSVCVCCGGQRCRWGGGVFIAFNPGQWDCRGESERVLFELMKRKPFTLLHKDAQLCLCYGLPFSLKVEWDGTEQNILFALCSLFRFNPQKSTKSHANCKQDLRNGWGLLEL